MKRRTLQDFALTHRNVLFWIGLLLTTWLVHFHDPHIFSRPLIDHDDTIFISPLTKLDWSSYFSSWLPDRSHYAFPLRDLTFFIDFKLSALTGVQTYWISNFLFFALGLFFTHRVFRLLFSSQQGLVYFLTAVVALHPLNVEMVQWASMRKHLLAALFVSYGSFHVMRLYLDEKRKLHGRDLARLLAVTIVSLLCWPTAILWPLAAVWLLRKKLLKQKAPVFALTVGSILFWAAAFRLISGTNTDYSRNETTLFTPEGITTAFQWAWRGLGRATFNLLLPIRESAYYDATSILNKIGIILLAAMLLYFAWITLRTKENREFTASTRMGWDLLAYAAFFFVPQFFVVLINSGLVWADHYLYTSFPYIVAAVACFAQAPLKWLLTRARPVSIVSACGLLGAFYIACALAQVPSWRDAITLLESCAEKEGAPLCIILTIEKKYDAGGCPKAFPYFDAARQIYLERQNRGELIYDGPFELELPMMESLCTATAQNIPLPQKLKLLEEQQRFYQRPTSLFFAHVLSHLEARDFAGAWKVARSTYLDPNYVIHRPNEKILTLLSGQGAALCELAKAMNAHPECPTLLSQYRTRITPYIFDGAGKAGEQIEWATRISLLPYSKPQR